MSALFARGHEMGQRGYPWVKNLPGLQSTDQAITAQIPSRSMATALR